MTLTESRDTEISNARWYDNEILVILFLFLFAPIGLYGTVKISTWSKGVKTAIFVIVLLPVLMMAIYAIGIVGFFVLNGDPESF